MPKMSEHNPYLTAYMVKTGDLLKLLDKGEFRDPQDTKFNREVFQITVGLPNNQTKIWTMNKTPRDKLTLAYGDDTDGWVGRWVKVRVSEVNVRGELKQVIYGDAAETPLVSQKLT